jgi:hypothetical protein
VDDRVLFARRKYLAVLGLVIGVLHVILRSVL